MRRQYARNQRVVALSAARPPSCVSSAAHEQQHSHAAALRCRHSCYAADTAPRVRPTGGPVRAARSPDRPAACARPTGPARAECAPGTRAQHDTRTRNRACACTSRRFSTYNCRAVCPHTHCRPKPCRYYLLASRYHTRLTCTPAHAPAGCVHASVHAP